MQKGLSDIATFLGEDENDIVRLLSEKGSLSTDTLKILGKSGFKASNSKTPFSNFGFNQAIANAVADSKKGNTPAPLKPSQYSLLLPKNSVGVLR